MKSEVRCIIFETNKGLKTNFLSMKTKMFIVLGVLVASLVLVACIDDDVIRDYANYNAKFTVSSSVDNTDLLANPDFLNKTYVEHRGTTYPVIQFGDKDFGYHTDEIKSRYNMPYPCALRLFRTDKGRYVLAFGEFGPEEQYKNETFIIHWGDGSSNTISFNLYLKGHNVRKHSKLDGKKSDFFVFNLKK